MTESKVATHGGLRPALLMFGLVYLALSAVATAVLFAFDLNGSGGLSIGVLVGATALGARSFVLNNHRAMLRGEQLHFALLGLAIILLITLLQATAIVPLIVSAAELPQLMTEVRAWVAANTGLLVIVGAIVVVLHFAILYFTSGWFSRMFSRWLATTGHI